MGFLSKTPIFTKKAKVMKKFLIGCAVATLFLTSAVAEAGSRQGRNHNSNDWVGPMIFGTVLGIIIANASNQNRVDHTVEYIEVCERVRRFQPYNRHSSYSIECRLLPKRVR